MELLFVFSIFFLCIEAFIYFYGQKEEEEICDYIVVLGCGLKGENVSPALQRRLDKALLYARKYPSIPIVVSGGKGSDEVISEAKAMKTYLLKQDIKEERMIEEDESVSTFTNFQFTKKKLGSANYKILVVTCDFHMYRSIALGRNTGFTCLRWPAKSTTLYSLKNYFREFFCIIYFWLTKQ